MSNAQIAAALSLINREIASEEERHQTLLAEAATVEKSIGDMQRAAQSLEALISGTLAERKTAQRSRPAARQTARTRAGKGQGRKTAGGQGRVAPAAVLVAITNSGQFGVKRSALSGLLANRKGEEPTRKALDEALQSLLSETRIRREGYRFVAVGEPAAEAVQAEFETLPDDPNATTGSGHGQEPVAMQSGDASIAFEEDPATGGTQETESIASVAAPSGGRRGRPRKAVSDDVMRAMNEVAGVIAGAGETGCKMSAIRAGVREVTGVSLSNFDAKRAVKDLVRDGRIRRDGYRYIAH